MLDERLDPPLLGIIRNLKVLQVTGKVGLQ